jgi:hypothetical protein
MGRFEVVQRGHRPYRRDQLEFGLGCDDYYLLLKTQAKAFDQDIHYQHGDGQRHCDESDQHQHL